MLWETEGRTVLITWGLPRHPAKNATGRYKSRVCKEEKQAREMGQEPAQQTPGQGRDGRQGNCPQSQYMLQNCPSLTCMCVWASFLLPSHISPGQILCPHLACLTHSPTNHGAGELEHSRVTIIALTSLPPALLMELAPCQQYGELGWTPSIRNESS